MDSARTLESLIYVVIALVGLKLLEAVIPPLLHRLEERKPLPYRVRDDFLSRAEHSFYLVLRQAVADGAAICPKVSLGDLFYASTATRRESASARNRIDRKHVDFVLCHPDTLRPVAGIELDDRSHRRSDRQERDRFVEAVFAAAGLPLVRFPVRSEYAIAELQAALHDALTMQSAVDGPPPMAETAPADRSPSEPPPCPRCGRPMVQRVARSGLYGGSPFWGCPDYPRCRGTRPM